MRNFKLLIIFLLCNFFCASVSFATYEVGAINVQKYGAIPNDGIDDTAAIQRAINAVQKVFVTPILRVYYSNQVLYFPPGRYDVTGPLVIPQQLEQIEGDGALLFQHSNTSDTITSTEFDQLTISGLKFTGGRHSIKITNNNLDTGRLVISGCDFTNTLDYAVFAFNSHSSILTIQKSYFYGVGKVFHTDSDWTRFEDSWVTVWGSSSGSIPWTSRSTDPDSECNDTTTAAAGVFCNANELTIENMLGVTVIPSRATFPRWVDNIGSLVVNHTRFGGEDGGFPPVYDYDSDPIQYNGAPKFIDVENSQTCGGAANGVPSGTDPTDSSIVNLRDGAPRLIKITGNTCILDNMPYIRAGTTDLVAFYAAAVASNPPSTQIFKYVVEPNNYIKGLTATVPVPMQPYVFVPLPIAF